MNLSGFSIDRRVTVLVLFLTTLVVGGIDGRTRTWEEITRKIEPTLES